MSNRLLQSPINMGVVEAYRLDRYDNFGLKQKSPHCFLNLQYGDLYFCLKMFVN